jgi:hypothetical protein
MIFIIPCFNHEGLVIRGVDLGLQLTYIPLGCPACALLPSTVKMLGSKCPDEILICLALIPLRTRRERL